MAIQLRWKLRSVATSQKVYRATSPLDRDALPAALATLANTDTAYLDSTATAFSTTYHYLLETILGADTVHSAQVSVTTAAAPPPPSGSFANFVPSGSDRFVLSDGKIYTVVSLTPPNQELFSFDLGQVIDANGQDVYTADPASELFASDGDALFASNGDWFIVP